MNNWISFNSYLPYMYFLICKEEPQPTIQRKSELPSMDSVLLVLFIALIGFICIFGNRKNWK